MSLVKPEGKVLKIHSAERITKRLKVKSYANDRRKVVISSNFLLLMDFHPGDEIVERSLGKGKGFTIERAYDLFDQGKTKKVYEREYKHRRNNPVETVLETASQRLLNESIPSDCEYVHIVMERGRVTVKPLTSHQQEALSNANSASDRLSAFVACTGGVDCHSLLNNGFTIHSVAEWRPREARDGQDLSETGALNALANVPNIRNIFNEDVMALDAGQLARAMKESPYTLFHMSPQCDDHSNVKAASLKARSVEDLSSTLDMGYDVLRFIEAMAPPTILLENVPQWLGSGMYRILELRLRRWGYRKHELVADARAYGGLTSRKRAYSFFTCLPTPFEFEAPQPHSEQPIWPLVEKHLKDCRNVSHSKSLQDGLKSGRLRLITPVSASSPTLLKSQDRMAKDSVVIQDAAGELWFPSEALMKELMGFGEGFSLESVSRSVGSEIIGQSIEVPLHDSVLRSVRAHIEAFYGSAVESNQAAA